MDRAPPSAHFVGRAGSMAVHSPQISASAYCLRACGARPFSAGRRGLEMVLMDLRYPTEAVVIPAMIENHAFLFPGCVRSPRPIIWTKRALLFVGLARTMHSVIGKSRPVVMTLTPQTMRVSPRAKRP